MSKKSGVLLNDWCHQSANTFLFFIFLVFSLWFGNPQKGLAAYYPNDPDYSKQWYLQKIGAPEAWSFSRGSNEIVVAVLDAGVDIDHPDLAPNIWVNPNETVDGKDNDNDFYVDDINGWDFVDGDPDPRPDLNAEDLNIAAIHHGTLVAGIIGALGDNALGITGLNWRVKIMPLRVLNSKGEGTTKAVEEAIRYAIAKKVDVINLSFIGPGFDRKLFLALRDAYQAGIFIVAAAGNQIFQGLNLDQTPLYPVCYRDNSVNIVFGVGAVDKNDQVTNFSNFGKNCVKLAAPGVDIYSTMVYKPAFGLTEKYGGGWQGTSLAAPMVAGAAALIKSIDSRLTPKDIAEILEVTADPLGSDVIPLGKGRLNLKKALELAKNKSFLNISQNLGLNFLLAAPNSFNKKESKLIRLSNNYVNEFFGLNLPFDNGVKLAVGDINLDGSDEIFFSDSSGQSGEIKVYKSNGQPLFSFFPFGKKTFRSGFSIVVGDFINNDNIPEIIVGAPAGAPPEIRFFSSTGKLLASIMAYEKSYLGGVNLALSDLDKDGLNELIIAPGGAGKTREIKILNSDGTVRKKFSPFPNEKFGINIDVGDVDGDGEKEIVTAPKQGGLSEIKIFNKDGEWLRSFRGFKNFNGGTNLTVGDLNEDGVAEIAISPEKNGGPHIIIFDGYGRLLQQFFVFEKNFLGGVSLKIIKL